MWRGVTRMKPFLTGASMAVAGWLEVGKMVIYPIRSELDADRPPAHQLGGGDPVAAQRDAGLEPGRQDRAISTRPSRTGSFDWLDCAALIRDAEQVLEYPMVDRDPLPYWTRGRITLLGDAAHPMYPRGSNGAGQAILDARALDGLSEQESEIPKTL